MCVHRAENFTVAGHKLRMVALPAAYVAALQGACKLMGIRAASTMFLDLACLVPKDKLADAHGVYPTRAVAATRQVPFVRELRDICAVGQHDARLHALARHFPCF